MKILYEDNHVIVAYKEAGILAQEDITKSKDILNSLKAYIKERYNKSGEVYLGLVHRLDRNTSGLMVFARTSKAAARLSEQIRNHSNFNKKYLAIVEGKMEINEEKTLINNLVKNESQNKSYVSKGKDAKEAKLIYKVLDSKNIDGIYYSLLDITLLTGRHHQIRCQLSHINHPIAGDVKYGAKKLKMNEYDLSSYSLSFLHPTLKKEMNFKYMESYSLFKYFDEDILKKYEL